MKILFIGIGALVAVLIVAVIVVPMLIPLETYKTELAKQVEEATGRKLEIAGDLSLSVFPQLEVEAEGISLSNAAGAKSAKMLELDKLQVELDMLSLITGDVVIERFVLVEPVVNLEVDRQGRPNWQLGQKGKTTSKPGASSKPPAGKQQMAGGLPFSRLGDIRLVNGRINYFDGQTGDSKSVTDINMRVALPDLDSEFEAEGALTWNGERIDLNVDIKSPRALSDGKPSKIEAKLGAKPLQLGYQGTLQTGKMLSASGVLNLTVPSVRKLAAWAGQPIEGGGTGLGALKVSGRLQIAGPVVSFKDAKLGIDGMNAKGDFSIDQSGGRPAIKARMDIDKLDLNTYSDPKAGQRKSSAGGARTGGQAGKPPASSDWSDEPIDVSGLKAFDADVSLRVGQIIAQKIKIGSTALALTVKDGRLGLDLKEMALYGGNGTAHLALDATRRVPALRHRFDLSGIKAGPFLNDAMGLDRLDGTGHLKLSIAAAGRSQRQMISALNGSGNIKFLNGAIRGINLAAMVRNIKSAFLDPKSRESQKTDFSELTGTFKIVSGVMHNNDLRLKSPLLRLEGQGRVVIADDARHRLHGDAENRSLDQGPSAWPSATLGGISIPNARPT